MKLSYYPGCSLQGTALDYDISVRDVCRRLDIELIEIDDWNCCGASSAHMTSHEIGVRLPMRNLLRAARLGYDILVPCAACFQRLKAADKELRKDPAFWDQQGYNPDFNIVHISSLLARAAMTDVIRSEVKLQLSGLKVACYYGCLSLRNPKITDVNNCEQPGTLESIMEAVGATPVSWSHRTECCSGSLTMARPDIARKLVGDIVAAAGRGGAEAMVTDCPMCQANVESRQLDLEMETNMPVFFATEILLAALSGEYPAKQKRAHLVAPDIMTDVIELSASPREETV